MTTILIEQVVGHAQERFRDPGRRQHLIAPSARSLRPFSDHLIQISHLVCHATTMGSQSRAHGAWRRSSVQRLQDLLPMQVAEFDRIHRDADDHRPFGLSLLKSLADLLDAVQQ